MLLVQFAALAAGRDPGAPKNFVRHPVSDTGKSALEKEDRLDRRAAVSPDELSHFCFGELAGMNFWRARFPPTWRVRAVMEADPAELPRVAENKRPLLLSQDEVIVLVGSKISRFHPELAAHSKMNPEPVIAGKHKEHLLPACAGAEQPLARETTIERRHVRSAKESLLPVQLHRQDLVADPGVPSFPKILDLGQLRHGRRLERSAASMLPLARMEKVIIVGSGCAGLTAAIYAARANLNPLVLEGRQPGGQLSTTTLVENFPGFPEGIDGPQLIVNMHKQAEHFGARFSYAEATDLELTDGHMRLKADDEWIETQALIIASGASARYLGLENEEKLIGHGLTSCATCDGAFYRNVPVCVIWRRRLRGRGSAFPHPLRLEGLSDSSARSAARFEDHGRPRAGLREDRADLEHGA